MACDVSQLLTDACTNGFQQIAAQEVLCRGIILQELYQISGSTRTETQLLQDACDNGFLQIASDEQLSRGVILQLLCSISGG